MHNVGKLVFRVLPLVLFLASCTDSKLHYLGYTYWGSGDPKVDYSAWGRDYSTYQNIGANDVDYGPSFRTLKYDLYRTKSNNYGMYEKPTLILFNSNGFGEHGHYLLRDYKYAVFCPEGYVSEMDIRELEIKLHSITKRTLNRMIAPMNKKEFVYDQYSKKFCLNLSNAIKNKVMSIPAGQFDGLAGWQMFKPTEGLDDEEDPYSSKIPYRYKVTYMEDDWYKIYSPYSEDNDSIYVKVGFAGKYFNSKIIGLRNDKMNVDIYDTDYDTRFNNKMLTFTFFDDIIYTHMFMKFLCPKVYKMIGKNGIILHEDFPKAIDTVVAKEKAFVYEFYNQLLASGNDARKIIKQYRYQMARHFAVGIDEQVIKTDYGVEMFLPCRFEDFAANGYTVDYMGEDCFKVTADGKSIFLKVVLYGNNMTPAIMGMINPAQNIDYCPDRFPWPKSIN